MFKLHWNFLTESKSPVLSILLNTSAFISAMDPFCYKFDFWTIPDLHILPFGSSLSLLSAPYLLPCRSFPPTPAPLLPISFALCPTEFTREHPGHLGRRSLLVSKTDITSNHLQSIFVYTHRKRLHLALTKKSHCVEMRWIQRPMATHDARQDIYTNCSGTIEAQEKERL